MLVYISKTDNCPTIQIKIINFPFFNNPYPVTLKQQTVMQFLTSKDFVLPLLDFTSIKTVGTSTRLSELFNTQEMQFYICIEFYVKLEFWVKGNRKIALRTREFACKTSYKMQINKYSSKVHLVDIVTSTLHFKDWRPGNLILLLNVELSKLVELHKKLKYP